MLNVFPFQCVSLMCDIEGLSHSVKNVGILPEGSTAPGRMIDAFKARALHELEAAVLFADMRQSSKLP
jgi:hypothetical protein